MNINKTKPDPYLFFPVNSKLKTIIFLTVTPKL